MQIQLVDARLALRNSTTRLPFRYGSATLTWCPQAIVQVHVVIDGAMQAGFSGDCLPPGWFDKSPDKTYEQQIDDMMSAIGLAAKLFGERFQRTAPFFAGWYDAQVEMQREAAARLWPGLLASFGASMIERAMIDAAARRLNVSFARLVRDNLLQIDFARLDDRLAGHVPRDWLPVQPRESIFVRHTVGLSDPLTDADVAAEERLDDGQPQSLEQYVKRTGIRYLKVKVRNQLEEDLERLRTIAAIVEQHRGADYRLTLDGNEQYRHGAEFDSLIDAIKRDGSLNGCWRNTLWIEQPLARGAALRADQTEGIRQLAYEKPVIIDESDESLTSYQQAIELGYRGVSSKNCKGAIKSVVNAGITWKLNQQAATASTPSGQSAGAYLMSGEDLCCVGIVPVQSDLCLVATLGLEHAERNGHHYHPGLAYLPAEQQQAALAQHRDLYHLDHGTVRPALRDGRFQIGSLQCVGFGFAVLPDFDHMTPVPL
jgi:L-alanine-DL-glutamate epimerase-like enolase superfamily enzyme